MKKIAGLAAAAAILLSIIVAATAITHTQPAGTSSIFGDYAYNGGHFFIDLIEQADNGNIVHIYGEFQYLPDKNDISGNVTIIKMDTLGNQLEKRKGTIKYENGALIIQDDTGRVYYRYIAQNAREAFWKGFIAVYEYEMHRKTKRWTQIELNVVNPSATRQQNEKIIGYQTEIIPQDKFEKMNLGQFGLIGPFKYYIIKIPDPRTGVIISVKLVVLYNNAIVFSQEIGIRPQQNNNQR